MTTETVKQAREIIEITTAIGDVIKASGPLGVPSGHVYAAVMSVLNIDQYNSIIAILVRAKLVRLSRHVLYWQGLSKV